MNKRVKEHKKRVSNFEQRTKAKKKTHQELARINVILQNAEPKQAIDYVGACSLSLVDRLSLLANIACSHATSGTARLMALSKFYKLDNTYSRSDILRKSLLSMETAKNKEEGKTVSMNGQHKDATTASTPNEPVYKIVPQVYAALGAYLLTRPFKEVKDLYAAFYKHTHKDPFYKQDAINALVDYLMSCPMGEVEPIIDMLQGGGLQQFVPSEQPVAEGGQKTQEGEQKAAPTQEGEQPAVQ